MKILAITHGAKGAGANPSMTDEGKAAVSAAIQRLDSRSAAGIKHFIIGTGMRFLEVAMCASFCLFHDDSKGLESVKYSPLLGSADSGKQGETGFEVLLPDGTIVPVGDYIGLIGTPGIDLWAWLATLPEGTLLCTGREFIGAFIKGAKSAAMYEIDTEKRTFTELT